MSQTIFPLMAKSSKKMAFRMESLAICGIHVHVLVGGELFATETIEEEAGADVEYGDVAERAGGSGNQSPGCCKRAPSTASPRRHWRELLRLPAGRNKIPSASSAQKLTSGAQIACHPAHGDIIPRRHPKLPFRSL